MERLRRRMAAMPGGPSAPGLRELGQKHASEDLALEEPERAVAPEKGDEGRFSPDFTAYDTFFGGASDASGSSDG